ncbi:hypothetical protein BKA56DRAFT_9924 [Ilyonectria sp. MPI-CAGE-AT-0026]|nr:hypothetical protein BKA56DRAFT_9924 [Ilyonectria sp. MPI-CAGE-AT-0026]
MEYGLQFTPCHGLCPCRPKPVWSMPLISLGCSLFPVSALSPSSCTHVRPLDMRNSTARFHISPRRPGPDRFRGSDGP